jgi:hypothetical protein
VTVQWHNEECLTSDILNLEHRKVIINDSAVEGEYLESK